MRIAVLLMLTMIPILSVAQQAIEIRSIKAKEQAPPSDFQSLGDNTVIRSRAYEPSYLPKNFPKYLDTGNLQEDRGRYEVEKRNWAVKYPKEFEEFRRKCQEKKSKGK